ncbi:hypothetical protein D3C72_2404430 [compost metagenome]
MCRYAHLHLAQILGTHRSAFHRRDTCQFQESIHPCGELWQLVRVVFREQVLKQEAQGGDSGRLLELLLEDGLQARV